LGRRHRELLDLATFELGEPGRELRRVLLRLRLDCPVLARLEREDLFLALADHAQRRALHAPGGSAREAGLLPEQRRDLEAHEVVERAARQVSLHELVGDRARVIDGFLHGVLRDLVEDAAVHVLAVERAGVAKQLVQVPGDRLALAVGVGREIQRVGLLHGARDRVDVLAVLVDQLPAHLEVARGVDGAFLGHEVADVAIGRHHLEVLAEVLLDGLGLGRRLDDDEVLGHVLKNKHAAADRGRRIQVVGGRWSVASEETGRRHPSGR
jgi:hypothetical protein